MNAARKILHATATLVLVLAAFAVPVAIGYGIAALIDHWPLTQTVECATIYYL